jgi:hypothetical protein
MAGKHAETMAIILLSCSGRKLKNFSNQEREQAWQGTLKQQGDVHFNTTASFPRSQSCR